MKYAKTPLGLLYTKSTMECHHYEKCVSILSDPNCNIFCDRSEAEVRYLYDQINYAIISTDLAVYFQHKKHYEHTLQQGPFNLDVEENLHLAKACLMTMCDLTGI